MALKIIPQYVSMLETKLNGMPEAIGIYKLTRDGMEMKAFVGSAVAKLQVR